MTQLTVTAVAPAVALLRGARYARISDDKAGDAHGVATQLADQAAEAAKRDIQVVMTRTDNDIGAYTGKRRPGYEEIMAAVVRGEIDVILVYQTSRFWRNRRERADGIEVLRKYGVSVIAIKGPSLNMSNAYERAMAGILGEFDTMEVEVKAERQATANAAAARHGKRRTGAPRAFGYERTHERCTTDIHRCTWHHVPAEAAAIRDAAKMILGGGTVSGVMREWTRLGVRPVQSKTGKWTRQSIRAILLNPTLAGLPVYGGEVIGLDPGAETDWEPILPVETWQAVKSKLEAPERKPPRGVRTLGGGLYLCECGNHMEGTVNHRGARIYRCSPPTRPSKTDYPGTHVTRQGAPVDYYVEQVIIERLSRPDAAVLLSRPAPAGPDVAQLREEYAAIRANLDSLAADRAMGLIDRSQLVAATERGRARMAQIDAVIASLAGSDALAGIATGSGARDSWQVLDLSRKRAVVRALMTVTLASPGRGNRREFNPETVRIDWVRGSD
jgi:DNA invertase Pin-like site-specific DNA recombinase